MQPLTRQTHRLIAALILAISSVLAAPIAAAQTAAASGSDAPTTNLVRLSTRFGKQLDVWIDGKRQGVTPLDVILEPGNHFLTAGAPGLKPVLDNLKVAEKGRQQTVLIDIPLTPERYDAAFKEVVASRVKYPRNAHVLILAAQLTEDESDFQRLLGMIAEEQIDDPLLLLARARWEYRRNDAAGALELLTRAIDLADDFAPAWCQRANLHTLTGDFEKALSDANRAVVLEPYNARNFEARADAYYSLGKMVAARTDYERALALDPGSQHARQGLDAARSASTP